MKWIFIISYVGISVILLDYSCCPIWFYGIFSEFSSAIYIFIWILFAFNIYFKPRMPPDGITTPGHSVQNWLHQYVRITFLYKSPIIRVLHSFSFPWNHPQTKVTHHHVIRPLSTDVSIPALFLARTYPILTAYLPDKVPRLLVVVGRSRYDRVPPCTYRTPPADIVIDVHLLDFAWPWPQNRTCSIRWYKPSGGVGFQIRWVHFKLGLNHLKLGPN